MINSAFIQENLPKSEVQEQLLRDKFKAKEAEGYTFEFFNNKKGLNNLKLGIAQKASDIEYTIADINDVVDTLLDSLVEGIIREADIRGKKHCQYHFTLEALVIPWGGELLEYSGYILFQPNYKRDTNSMFYGLIAISFD